MMLALSGLIFAVWRTVVSNLSRCCCVKRFIDDGRSHPAHRRTFRCSECRSPFTCPIDWSGAPSGTWKIHFRCGECGHFERHVFDENELAVLERALDQGTHDITVAVQMLADTSETDVVDRFHEET